MTPLFQAPDESEHFAAAQFVAETGRAVDRNAGSTSTYSGSQTLGFDAVRHFSVIEVAGARPPWRSEDERSWYARVDQTKPRQDDGGGFAIASSGHSPLYYTFLAPAYLVTSKLSLPSQLLAMRLVSAALPAGGDVNLTVLELLRAGNGHLLLQGCLASRPI